VTLTYWQWLAVLSATFVVLERLAPRRRDQRVLRRGLLVDLGYVVLNGHFLGVALALAVAPLTDRTDGVLRGVSLDLASRWPWAAQLVVAFFAIDLLQWSIHNLLHRVPWLWELHKVHHSPLEMDWAASMRVHWLEIVVYKSLQYVPLALLGFDGSVMMALAVIGTAIGHYNHANLRWDLGPLKYLLNGPHMHRWHHAHPEAFEGGDRGRFPVGVNYAINLSLWDWIFGTAYMPVDAAGRPRDPSHLGFEGIERFPEDLPRQELWPLVGSRPARQERAAADRSGPAT
jgi:sterol desaturase/sphingolipid hydroxylase (fatty acid hydroxylase superfamily)